jgi:hypothetical protein
LERKSLWHARERIGGGVTSAVVDLVRGYQKILLTAQPRGGDGAATLRKAVGFS